MSKASQNANAVGYAIGQVCGLYGVELFRMQSRVVTVPGAAGRDRPMFFGEWTDQFGNKHHRGMADWLVRPRVPCCYLIDLHSKTFPATFGADPPAGGVYPIPHNCAKAMKITVPLWIEGKSGKGTLTPDQVAFKAYVEWNGEAWINVHDDIRPLMDWFEAHGVKK